MAITGDFVLKLQRAHSHMEDLDHHINKWLHDNRYTQRRERDVERPENVRFFITADPIPHDPFALLIGDALHNLRASLDHMVYVMTTKHAKSFTEEIAEQSAFPIFGDEGDEGVIKTETKYASSLSRKIGALPDEAQTVIKSLQPYHRGKDYLKHPLWLLDDLVNRDKHRLLLLSNLYVVGILTGSRAGSPEPFVDFTRNSIINGETEIAHIEISPEDEMDVEITPSLDVAFQCGGTAHGKAVRAVLHDIHTHIGTTVISKLAKFL